MSYESTTLVGAFILGLMGASHCVGMCGGIIGSLSMATKDSAKKWINISLYQFGRIASYTLFGLIAGWIGSQADGMTPIPILKTLSGILLILMGLYVSRIWMGLTYLEKIGKLLWDKISPLSKRLLPVQSPGQAILLGSLWGWLPCGLVYTALGFALAASDPLYSSMFMLNFGIGTLPATLLAGAASLTLKQWLNKAPIRTISALVFIGLGVWTLYTLYFGADMGHHHHH
ncbi:sulfite exporter TauE/SafE family protein [Aliikangiella marina]|uniref:Sulfite exporter TauE/SafE family protein n=1 Tax=Aliikangiella marina TaxID=1712262 RepID=A0A545TJX9_9GAMM|nr:sulfite exporter TauE/SafE family protein [Aliikangiella marina]TQV77532.1 sulfite exporter TauE/SafE family protein [Aliikangiella marina]